MPNAGELFGGFWDAIPSPVIDDLAAAVTILEDAAVGQITSPATHIHIIRSDQVITATATSGRTVTSYPAPPDEPAWIVGSSASVLPVLCRGIDYELNGNRILYDIDPLIVTATRTLWDAGEPVIAATLWYGTQAKPAPEIDPQAATYSSLVTAIADACDSPRANGTETVEAVFTSDDGVQVVTDQTVYRLGVNDVASVSADTIVTFGRPVGSAWTLTKLGPAKPAILYLTTPVGFHQGSTVGGITWYDESVPTVIDVFGGRTRVRFRLGAASQIDLDAFWTAAHANGVSNGKTTAQALDLRGDSQTTEPSVQTLPTFVNPLELVCRELLGGNAWLLVVDPTKCGSRALSSTDRSVAVLAAAGPYTTIFVYEGTHPALTRYNPS